MIAGNCPTAWRKFSLPRPRPWSSLRRRLLDLYRSWGYQLVIPPLVEFTDSLLVGLGEDLDLLTFKLTDQLTGRTMGVRADITPQVARIDAHSLAQEGVSRLCYAGSTLHTRPKSLMASRSPIQLGAELYGDDSSGRRRGNYPPDAGHAGRRRGLRPNTPWTWAMWAFTRPCWTWRRSDAEQEARIFDCPAAQVRARPDAGAG